VTRRRAEAALLFNTLIWGSTFVVVKQALEAVSPLLFLALRFSIATLVLLALFRGQWQPAIARQWRGGVLVGIFLFAGYAFQTFGLRLTSPPKSAFITGLSVPMVPLLAALVYGNRPRATELAGVALATAGLGLLTLEGAALAVNPGDLLTMACAVAFAGHIVALGHYSQRAGFEVLSFTQVATSALLALSLFWWAETPRIRGGWGVWGAVALTGVAATGIAFTLQAWAQRYTTSTRTALIFTMEPVFAWLTSYLVTGETLSRRGAGGAALILAGILLAELKPLNRKVHPSN